MYNAKTGNAYNGKNLVDLAMTAKRKGYTSDQWVTFLQAKELGRTIKKGEHGVSIFCGFRPYQAKDEDGKLEDKKAFKFARVFNLDQTEEASTDEK